MNMETSASSTITVLKHTIRWATLRMHAGCMDSKWNPNKNN